MLKHVYDIHLHYLGVNPPLTPPRRGRTKSGGKKEEVKRSRRTKVFWSFQWNGVL
ncbi:MULTISPECIES: hypothetical protein [unclassified Okeania]|uniref:hypothetical protein n=1 Tax=unclassified Okeania TaxID=2634635 RepID=UPI0013B88F94|nr:MULTISPECIES: hypothetical protein [unclassified Okeania]NET21827.1 hypothetical protein [Okeania sp. SIO1H5]NET95221.1 hypothetical protein [Okeania sp. SIO1H2]